MERDVRQVFRWVCRGKALIYDSGRVPARKAPGKALWAGACRWSVPPYLCIGKTGGVRSVGATEEGCSSRVDGREERDGRLSGYAKLGRFGRGWSAVGIVAAKPRPSPSPPANRRAEWCAVEGERFSK